jgi:phosphatidylglycerophosphate synthase
MIKVLQQRKNSYNNALLTGFEQSLLFILCRHTPTWVTSNALTLLGVVGAAIAFVGLVGAHHAASLWLAIVGIVINWFGDSMDGSLARFRQSERPKFGFFIDHTSDALSVSLICVGIALSPYANIVSGMILLVGYYLVFIITLIVHQVTGTFRISFGRLGPTEMRLLLILCFLGMITMPVPTYTWADITVTVYDIVFVTMAGLMVVAGTAYAIKTGRALSISEPRVDHT